MAAVVSHLLLLPLTRSSSPGEHHPNPNYNSPEELQPQDSQLQLDLNYSHLFFTNERRLLRLLSCRDSRPGVWGQHGFSSQLISLIWKHKWKHRRDVKFSLSSEEFSLE